MDLESRFAPGEKTELKMYEMACSCSSAPFYRAAPLLSALLGSLILIYLRLSELNKLPQASRLIIASSKVAKSK